MDVVIYDLYPLLGAASWAFSSAIIRNLEEIGSPVQLNFIRTAIGAILFLIHALLVGTLLEIFEISLLIIFYLVLSVFLNVVIGDSLYFASQNRIGVKIATPIVNTYPLFTILFAIIFLDERISQQLVIGGVIIIIGIGLLSIEKGSEKNIEDLSDILDRKRLEGLVFALIAVIMYAWGIIFTTLGAEGLKVSVANSVRLPSGTILLFFLIFIQQFRSSRIRSDTSDSNMDYDEFMVGLYSTSNSYKIQLLIAGILGTYISSLFLVLSVQSIGASRTAVLFSTGPFFALPVAILWLKEKVSLFAYLGTILTVIGLWIILV